MIAAAFFTNAEGMRRDISTANPMWLIHIDGLYNEDAQKCIDAVPEDIMKYVVFNISATTPDKYQFIEKSLDVCLANNVLAMVQCSAGARNSMSDTDLSGYKVLYEKYPNLIGFNFCEQGWGFDKETLVQRLNLFIGLLELAEEFGGYLYVNDEHSIANNPINTLAKQRVSKEYVAAAKKYSEHFIFGYKTTMGYGFYDNESACLGMFLAGLCDHYAIRFDQYAWSYSFRGEVFGEEYGYIIPNSLAWFSCPEAVSGIMIAENMMMQGATVIDGPEIPVISCMIDGQITPQFKNVICDIFRKYDEGKISIPTRQEVLDATKFAFVCNTYNTVDEPLYEGLYQMDGHRKENRSWLKRSGRYPTIPTLVTTPDNGLFDLYVTQSGAKSYSSRWATTEDKVSELNRIFPEFAQGDMYVRTIGKEILAYNPYLNIDKKVSASFKLAHNSIDLEFAPHTFAIIDQPDNQRISIYLNNYRTDKSELWKKYPCVSEDDGLPRMTQGSVLQYMRTEFIDNPTDAIQRISVVKISGCKTEPFVEWNDRGEHRGSLVNSFYKNGVLSLEIRHNGPIDIEVDLHEDTAVSSINVDTHNDKANNSSYYDLLGRRVADITTGMYILNGEKVLIK